MRSTINTIQLCRGIAALAVVLFHMFTFGDLNQIPSVLPSAFLYGEYGVDIFFVISGIVMTYTTAGLPEGAQTSGRFLFRRLARIYPIYWVYTLILLATVVYSPLSATASRATEIDLISSFLLLPSDGHPLLTVGWSLVYELWFYVVFALFLLLPRRLLPALLILWAAFIFATQAVALNSSSPFIRHVTSPYTLQFIAGAAGGFLMGRLSATSGKLLIGAALIGAISFFSIYGAKTHDNAILAFGFGTIVTCLIIGSAALELNGSFKWMQAFKWTGDISYSVYLSHLLVFAVFFKLWRIAPITLQGEALFVIAFWAALLVAVIVWSWISYTFIERPIAAVVRMFRRSRAPKGAAVISR